ncbi:HupU protein [Rhodoblastus acidophilus]|uniref:hydrogenase (acceptor) n=1 Tax=Candidatus Rhodoblastus alkanivorans TaxID=2954117 RepID=A0ABS9Z2B6_9HYPH|nr:HupU protein [Candidatus Rhodoblastus alkanivorans]MCI4677440.1 HupU protein [Candidatus Rhodoblastus alkanivorans]MCI4681799.1 HupU protein [Candidatus Rhodoblastus alkanivorans]MDI4642849.1 HupU protein [Rhodoblastus acidophilus]
MVAVPTNLLWLQAGSCGGCTMSVLEQGASGWFAELKTFGLNLLWHPSVSEESGEEVLDILARIESGETLLDILCVEGSILRGPQGTGMFNRLSGTKRSLLDIACSLAKRAQYCVAIGSCAAFGGVPAGDPDPTDACGLHYDGAEAGGALGRDYRSGKGLPVINVAGCAPHPGWIMETLQALATHDLTAADLDALGRPTFFAAHLAHHGCSRNEFYEFKASARVLSERGCLMEHLGCKATQAIGDCNQRAWNGGGSCTHGGFACISCTAPNFENGRNFHVTPKIAGIPVGLPLDMPKAWFMTLAALSKSATPERVRKNAEADRIVENPRRGK